MFIHSVVQAQAACLLLLINRRTYFSVTAKSNLFFNLPEYILNIEMSASIFKAEISVKRQK